ncbi:MAG: HlyD family secretion protein [Verrucomicrobiota bacterium]|jgi:membrane fusion protein (multidrug efflux system)
MNESKSAPANPPPPVNGKQLAKPNTPLFIWPATMVLAVLLFLGLDYLVGAFTHESTDDAFIEAHITAVAPRVAGQVLAVHVDDNEMVRSNDVLVELDPSTYAITAAQKQASAEAQMANYRAFVATYELMRTKVATAQATAKQSAADTEAAAATAKRTADDFVRMESLRKQNTISQQEFDAAQAVNQSAQANLDAARQKAAADDSKITEAQATVTATEAAVGTALAQWQESQTNIEAAKLDLSYTTIVAPCDGRVTRKSVEPGDYVQVGQQLMSIVPTNVWVVANFKETQLKHMQTNQPVRVEIDALGRSFRAHVDSVQAGSGAQFSLLPPENATGNYVKVVQRVPVKIIFDEPLPTSHTLGPGMSVMPEVRISPFEIPDWAIALVAVVLAVIAGSLFRLVLNRKTGSSHAR